MLFPKTKKIGKENDWHRTNNTVFGLYKEYLFTVGDAPVFGNSQFKYIIASTDNLSEQQKGIIKLALEENKKFLKFNKVEFGDNFIYIQFNDLLGFTKLKTLYSVMDFLVNIFLNLGLSKMRKCQNCEKKENIKYYRLIEVGTILCHTCYKRTQIELIESESAPWTDEKKYHSGLLGSLLFSIPAILVWITVATFFGGIASTLSVLIGYFGIKGYAYFNGKQCPLTKYLIILSNIICLITANYLTVCVTLWQKGAKFDSSLSILFTNNEIQELFFKNILVSIALNLIVWIWLFSKFKEKKLTIVHAERVNKLEHSAVFSKF